MRLTREEIRMLGESERLMDEGKVPFVKLGDQRVMVNPDAMAEFGLQQGQTINLTIMCAILEFTIAHCEAQIAIAKARAPFKKEAQS